LNSELIFIEEDGRVSYQRLLLCAVFCLALQGTSAGTGKATKAKDLSRGGIVLLLGDSILDCHEGEQRVEAVMKRLLDQRTPNARWTIFNEAHGGEYVGPREGSPKGVSEPLFTTETTGRFFDIVKRHPHVDAVFVNYAGNDSKVYPPSTFRRKLEFLGGLLENTYPGAILIFSTSMFLDPKHAAPYHIDDPKVPGFKPGSLRNQYLEPYNKQIRKFTVARGYRPADIYRRILAETKRGNWDLRVRADEGDPKDDPKHEGDMHWFDNIHPNAKGTEIIADLYVRILARAH
jgi:lysophospholipase L1-like esterase